MSLLEIRSLTVAYGKVVAVRDVDLTLEEGTVGVVVGVNGAGKSSLMNAVSGLAPVTSGSIHLRGQSITRRASHRIARAGVVQVPEGRRIFSPLSVEDNLLVGGHAVPAARRHDLLDRVYTLFPVLQERRRSTAGLLSGGQQQMVAFGRALMADPTVLLLDEPSMGLAPVMVDVVVEAVRSIAADGLSVLMVEQNAHAAFSVADTAHVLENGVVVASGPAAQIREDPRVVRAFLGIDVDAAAG
ncbi:ABC transporter ATP-binding protein [Nocardioides zeae]|uniref:ABC transporter ATP-binding protein n=1 Tax=Nocardioides imazamoxiresistens TaxID=3231893 RepID=A0ABU3PSL7_9ACTN|nr:ABC transporter ATP-binding protein [Nocardioides zeae]MDT9592207.1 ABC transporter ATP-binding protein [Nocardioides zeae]